MPQERERFQEEVPAHTKKCVGPQQRWAVKGSSLEGQELDPPPNIYITPPESWWDVSQGAGLQGLGSCTTSMEASHQHSKNHPSEATTCRPDTGVTLGSLGRRTDEPKQKETRGGRGAHHCLSESLRARGYRKPRLEDPRINERDR